MAYKNGDIKKKDFDAFRNTYMGFVFQEYNLLDNYSIGQNIKLPLELQHIKATNGAIILQKNRFVKNKTDLFCI